MNRPFVGDDVLAAAVTMDKNLQDLGSKVGVQLLIGSIALLE